MRWAPESTSSPRMKKSYEFERVCEALLEGGNMDFSEGNMTYGVLWISHRIEWTELHGKLVDDEVIGVVLSLYNSSKSFLILRANSNR